MFGVIRGTSGGRDCNQAPVLNLEQMTMRLQRAVVANELQQLLSQLGLWSDQSRARVRSTVTLRDR